MDPSSWANYTAAQAHYAAASRLRGAPGSVAGTAAAAAMAPNQQPSIGNHHAAHGPNQMSPYAANQMHTWLAMSHHHHQHHPGLNAGSHQSANHSHPDTASFSSNPFGLHPAHGMSHSYDASGFLPNPYTAAKAAYLPTPSNFFKQMSGKESDLRPNTAVFAPPPPTHCAPMAPPHGAAIGHHHGDGMGSSGPSLFPHSHLNPTSASWRQHQQNLMAAQQHLNNSQGNASHTSPFGILPHEAVNVMNLGGHSQGQGNHHHSHPTSNANHHSSNKSCSVESSKHNKTTSSVAFNNMMNQNMHHAAKVQNSHFADHLTSSKISHHQSAHQADPYLAAAAAAAMRESENYRYAAVAAVSNQHQHMLGMSSSSRSGSSHHPHQQYPGMNFPTAGDRLAASRDLMGVSTSQQTAHSHSNLSNHHSHHSNSKQSSNNSSCHSSSLRNNTTNANSYVIMSNCNNMMMGSAPVNNFAVTSPAHANNTNVTNHNGHGTSSRSSSAASNHANNNNTNNSANHGSESSSCSYGYNSPSANLPPHSPFNRNSVNVASVNSSHTPTPTAGVGNSVQDSSNYSNNTNYGGSNGSVVGYPSMSGSAPPTPTPGYPTPPASVTQASQSQLSSGPTQDDGHGMSLFPNPSQGSANGYHVPTQNHAVNNSSCMHAAAVTSNNQAYIHNNIAASLHEQNSRTCLSGMGASMNETMATVSSKVGPGTVSISGGQADPNLGAAFTEQEIDFPSINYPPAEDHAPAPFLRIDGHQNGQLVAVKKKKEKGKKKKKDKSKVNQQQQVTAVVNSAAFPPYQPFLNMQYGQDPFVNHMNGQQACHPYLMHQNQLSLSQHDVSQSLMPNTNVVPLVNGSSCYDTNHSLNIPNDLVGQAIESQMSSNSQQAASQASLSCEKSQPQPLMHHEQNVSLHAAPTLTTVTATEHHHSVDDKFFDGLEEDLSFLTEEASPTCPTSGSEDRVAHIVENDIPGIAVSTDHTADVNNSTSVCTESFRNTVDNTSQLLDAIPLIPDLIVNSTGTVPPVTTSTGPKASDEPLALNPYLNYLPEIEQKQPIPLNVNNSITSENVSENNDGNNSNKKKAKHKEHKNKNPLTNNLNGKKLKQLNKRTDHRANETSSECAFDFLENNISCPTSNQFNVSKGILDSSKKTGDSRFFKTRPLNTPTNEIIRKSDKANKKRKAEVHNSTPHDEYEFHESPTQPNNKKSKKSFSDGNKKKTEKCVSSNVNAAIKKASSKANKGIAALNAIKPVASMVCDIDLSFTVVKECKDNNMNVVRQSDGMDVLKPIIEPVINSKPQKINKSSSLAPMTTNTTVNQVNLLPASQIQMPKQLTPIQAVNNTNKKALTVLNKKENAGSVGKINQSVAVQSMGTNTPRRRSQDKKALTIREGLMRTGDFVVSLDESILELPMIWRIEGKSLLQRFEPSEQDGSTVYTNTSSYSAWNPTVRQRYTGVDVRVMGCSRTKIIVEKLGLTKANPNPTISNGEITPVERAKQSSMLNYQHQENFEVFIQTLISQALDPNFIAEIVKENDDYFLTHVQAIDEYCSRKKARFFSKVKWDATVVKCVESFPTFTVTPQNNVGDLRCKLCHDNWSSQILNFSGDLYDLMTLEVKEPLDIKQTKYAACDPCKERIELFSRLHHQKYNFYVNCRDKVEEMRGGDENKESHVILEQCLQDNEWIQKLFKELEEIWFACDKMR